MSSGIWNNSRCLRRYRRYAVVVKKRKHLFRILTEFQKIFVHLNRFKCLKIRIHQRYLVYTNINYSTIWKLKHGFLKKAYREEITTITTIFQHRSIELGRLIILNASVLVMSRTWFLSFGIALQFDLERTVPLKIKEINLMSRVNVEN